MKIGCNARLTLSGGTLVVHALRQGWEKPEF
jgi:hypothetical protein